MSDESADKVVIIATHGPEDPERATLPFVMATAAQVMENEAVIILQGNGVLLAGRNIHHARLRRRTATTPGPHEDLP